MLNAVVSFRAQDYTCVKFAVNTHLSKQTRAGCPGMHTVKI